MGTQPQKFSFADFRMKEVAYEGSLGSIHSEPPQLLRPPRKNKSQVHQATLKFYKPLSPPPKFASTLCRSTKGVGLLTVCFFAIIWPSRVLFNKHRS